MPFKTPDFWYKPGSMLGHALTPAAWLYQAGHQLNQAIHSKPYKSSVPVICVGNAIAGGGGKTPTTIALVSLLKENGITSNPFILTRGYGGTITTPTIVDSNIHTAKDVGDEPLLLSRHAQTIISANRAEGAKLAEQNNADLIIMDDGLVNNTLHKTITLLVIDRHVDFGNGKTIPAGPLREPLSKILPKTDAVICIGKPFHSDKEVFEASLKTKTTPDPSKKYIAFTGIAFPDKFRRTLNDNNMNITGWHEFADHHIFTASEINKLQQEAKNKDASLITTEKDYVRLPKDIASDIETLPVEITIKQPETLVSFIKDHLKSAT